uniref:Btz domain-containing protein n=1 Tax=Setaria digitata TaxID=48799 RepID=A0A915PW99_9BILA
MGSKGRSSGTGREEKSRRSLADSSGSRQERPRHKQSSSRRSNTPRKTATASSKVVSSKKPIHRSSPLRKSKPSPVNELDISALSQKEQQCKSGNRGRDGIQNRSERGQHRQFVGIMDRRGFWGSRNKMDYRRTPMNPLRRGIGGSDLVDQRAHYGRSGRQSYQRSTEQSKSTNDEEKPVMNLFDPCKVPTGRSYFTHDDRATKPVRISRSRYSASGDSGWQSLPVGWRNVRKTNLFVFTSLFGLATTVLYVNFPSNCCRRHILNLEIYYILLKLAAMNRFNYQCWVQLSFALQYVKLVAKFSLVDGPLVRRSDDVLHDDNSGPYHKKRSERNPADEMWKHDMFECEESESV